MASIASCRIWWVIVWAAHRDLASRSVHWQDRETDWSNGSVCEINVQLRAITKKQETGVSVIVSPRPWRVQTGSWNYRKAITSKGATTTQDLCPSHLFSSSPCTCFLVLRTHLIDDIFQFFRTSQKATVFTKLPCPFNLEAHSQTYDNGFFSFWWHLWNSKNHRPQATFSLIYFIKAQSVWPGVNNSQPYGLSSST